MKDTCRLVLSGSARALVKDRGDVVMAMASYGKGSAIAVVDPWLYNEYVNGRNLPPEYDNHAAGEEFVHWVLTVAKHHTHRK